MGNLWQGGGAWLSSGLYRRCARWGACGIGVFLQRRHSRRVHMNSPISLVCSSVKIKRLPWVGWLYNCKLFFFGVGGIKSCEDRVVMVSAIGRWGCLCKWALVANGCTVEIVLLIWPTGVPWRSCCLHVQRVYRLKFVLLTWPRQKPDDSYL